MKKQSSSRSAYTNFRIILAFTFCLGGFSLAVTAFGAWPELTAAMRFNSQNPNGADAKWKAKTKRRGGTSKSMSVQNSSGSGAAPANSAAQAQSGNGQSNTVTEYRNELGQTVYSVVSSGFDISPPLRDMATSLPEVPLQQRPELELPSWRTIRSDKPDPVTQVAPRARDSSSAPNPVAPTTGFNFAGIIGTGSYPPDTNGSVGNNQYVETVNTRYQVWTLNRGPNTVTTLVVAASINTLWTGFTGANGQCTAQNAGDPIVVYDKVANRWLISQFTSAPDNVNSSYYQCVAVSTTADASGTYARYAFTVPSTHFGDYPHFGVWTDAYYMMAHGFTAASGGSYTGGIFAAMDRTKMLAGDPSATWVVIEDPLESGHMPADLDGFAPPPGGAPGIFVSLHAAGMYLYRMKVDFTTPANTTRTLQAVMPTASANAACGGGTCIPQPGSGVVLDSLADRLMFRLAYRNFVDHESLVISHSVDPAITGVVSGVRWYDFRISGIPDAVCSSYPCTYQQGTIADVANGRSRWMPSISMDGAENILVGYSTTGKTNGSDNQSIRYTARAKSDPLGTMTAPETIIITGNKNSNANRWGDYTSTSIDPFDDCTFWHANEHYTTTGSAGFWKTEIASAVFPAGTGAGQCQPSTCTSRPASAPTIGTVSPSGLNQLQVSWTGIVPTPGSYAIERAIGAIGSEGLYQPVGFVLGGSTIFTDTSVQGGVTYTYRVIAATDAAGRCQSLLRSGPASGVATGTCNLKPAFSGATSANSGNTATCSVTINWSPGTSSCPNTPTVKYNVYRGTVPDFVPAAGNRIASCVPGPSSYTDSNNLVSGNTYYYVVRAEDNSTGNGGACGGNEESNSVVVAGTAYGSGVQASPGTWTDGGGDATAFLLLNPNEPGNSADLTWRFVKTADDAGANHTPGGAYAYRTAGPGAGATYSPNACSVAETPALTVGSTAINLTYWERHQLEKGWDGVAIEYSLNGGAWTDVPAPTSSTANGCLVSDITADYAALDCTGAPPANACGYPASKAVITGPIGSGTSCTDWVTGPVSAYGRRCHLLTGLTAGDTIKFRWRFSSDPGADFAGFYLDDIAVTNIQLPNTCTATGTPSPTPTATATATASPTSTATSTPTATATSTPTATATSTPLITATPTATATATATPTATATSTPTATATASPTATATSTPTATATASPTATATSTPTATATSTPTATATSTPTATATAAPTATATSTPTATATATPTATATATATAAPTATATSTPTATPTATATATATATPTATATATASSTATATATATSTPTATPTATPAAQTVNLSTRMRVDTGDNAGIGGFIITGNTPKRVVVRALGPSLTAFGFPVAALLADPILEIHGPGNFGTITNNNWKDTQQGQIQGAGLAPTNDLESAIDATLPPGNYSAVVRGNAGTPPAGIALVEVYDINTAVDSKLGNISTRAQVGTGSNVVIAGFILGNKAGNDRVVIRGLGPSLSAFGIPNPLQDPTLELRDKDGNLLRSNNDWQDDSAQAAQVTAAGLAPSNTKESAIAATLPPGAYTAILAGLNNGTGVGLVEVYDRGGP